MKKTLPKAKRLDGKKKLVVLTAKLENDMREYCRGMGIESESELVRQAIAKYIYNDYRDDTLKLEGMKSLFSKLEELRDMVSLLFSYTRLMHISTLAYHPEIDPELADAAFASANNRHAKFFATFQDNLKQDPPFFERLLHKYFTGENTDDGES